MSVLPAGVLARLLELKVRNPDPAIALHVDLVDTFTRLAGEGNDVVLVALQWCYQAEFARQGAVFANRKTQYEHVLGRAIVRYRAEGEKSAEVATHRAHAEDQEVFQAHLDYRVAEQALGAAKSGLSILAGQLSAWQTHQANARKADEFTARSQP